MKIIFVALAFVFGVFNPLSLSAQKIQAVVIPPEWNQHTNRVADPIEKVIEKIPVTTNDMLDYQATHFNEFFGGFWIANDHSGYNIPFVTTVHTLPKKFTNAAEAIAYRQKVASTLLAVIIDDSVNNKLGWLTNGTEVRFLVVMREVYATYPGQRSGFLFTGNQWIIDAMTTFQRDPFTGKISLAEDVHLTTGPSSVEVDTSLTLQMPREIVDVKLIYPPLGRSYTGLYILSADKSDGGYFTDGMSFQISKNWVQIPLTHFTGAGTLRIRLTNGEVVNYDLATGNRYTGPLPLSIIFEPDGTMMSLRGTAEPGKTLTIKSSTDLITWRIFESFKVSDSGAWTASLISPTGPKKFFSVSYK